MGWNSWDSYGATVTEAQFRANAEWLSKHLSAYGYKYVTVDMEWFTTNPTASGSAKDQQYTMDEFGRYTPARNRFPSAADGRGFGPLATYVHSLGLKFGIHILQGIPREAVRKNLKIKETNFSSADAAETTGTCRWNPDNYDVKHDAAGAAYYDSIAKLYASWGVDLIKVDCIASRPYKGDEVRMLRKALDRTGRPIAMSLSPGEPPIEEAEQMRANAQQWRISDDIWDLWHSTATYPQGLGDQFPRLAKWIATQREGSWPDADMLPLGYLGPHPGWGDARYTRLNHEEQQTLFTAWCIFRSPLMMGGDLPHMDAWTEALLTNREVIAVDQHSHDNRQIFDHGLTAWTAKADTGSDVYAAIFNRKDAAQTVDITWKELGISAVRYRSRDLWRHTSQPTNSDGVHLSLPSHSSILLRLQPDQRSR